MFEFLRNTILYDVFENVLATIISVVPGHDVGVAIIILTLLVRFALFPISKKSLESQLKMTKLSPELNKIKKSKASAEEKARLQMALYKKHKISPFSGCLPLLFQLPVIIILYLVFINGIDFTNANLWSFTPHPGNVNNLFLGIINLKEKSLILAILAGVSQFFHARIMPKNNTESLEPGSFQESFQKSMQMQMKYILPFFVVFFAYSLSGVIALYWFTSNMFAVGQQLYVNKKHQETEPIVKVID